LSIAFVPLLLAAALQVPAPIVLADAAPAHANHQPASESSEHCPLCNPAPAKAEEKCTHCEGATAGEHHPKCKHHEGGSKEYCSHCDAAAAKAEEKCTHCDDANAAEHRGKCKHHGDHAAHGAKDKEPCSHCDGKASNKHGDHAQHHADHAGGRSEHSAHAKPGDHSAHTAHGQHAMSTTGILGPYAMARDAAGTAWQPDATPHHMGHDMWGDWAVSAHAMLNIVYDWQDGPRGDEKTFGAGMVQIAARRDFGGDVLNLRAMLSPDALMGKRGYPLLLAAGETADGVNHLVDRQHPHDLFMELSASYSFALGDGESVFLYAGLPGEPAFGPPAFMHRMSAPSPEAPISHHWLDSTHIAFGVLTAGWVKDVWKVELSAFKGREPDQHRFDIESPKLDSIAARVSWNPTENWSLQASWADQNSVEQLEPLVDATKLSASAIYTERLAGDSWWSATLAWGWKDPSEGDTTNALALETAYAPNRDWTLFARAKLVEANELAPTTETVGKVSFGAIRDFAVAKNTALGVGTLYSVNFVPDALEPRYEGDPDGAMVFVRLTASS
jgi:hypothetical protein